jgi:hypothetical protein
MNPVVCQSSSFVNVRFWEKNGKPNKFPCAVSIIRNAKSGLTPRPKHGYPSGVIFATFREFRSYQFSGCECIQIGYSLTAKSAKGREKFLCYDYLGQLHERENRPHGQKIESVEVRNPFL